MKLKILLGLIGAGLVTDTVAVCAPVTDTTPPVILVAQHRRNQANSRGSRYEHGHFETSTRRSTIIIGGRGGGDLDARPSLNANPGSVSGTGTVSGTVGGGSGTAGSNSGTMGEGTGLGGATGSGVREGSGTGTGTGGTLPPGGGVR